MATTTTTCMRSTTAATVNVAPTGGQDIPNCGDVSSPCASLQYAISNRALPGDTVVAMPGVHPGPFGPPGDLGGGIELAGEGKLLSGINNVTTHSISVAHCGSNLPYTCRCDDPSCGCKHTNATVPSGYMCTAMPASSPSWLAQAWQAFRDLPVWAQVLMLLLIVALICAVVFIWRQQRRLEHEIRKRLESENKLLESENAYLRDWRIKGEHLTFEKKLAAGAEGEVWRGTLLGRSEKVAIKRALLNPATMDEDHKKPVWDEREVCFMMSIQHPRLVTFLGAGTIADEASRFHEVTFMVQEFMTGGSIDTWLWHKSVSSLNDVQRLQWASDISEGMAHIHQKGFAHRDLKSPNVLYDETSMRAKVTDFGMSRDMKGDADEDGFMDDTFLEAREGKQGQRFMTATCGTPEWMAPELAQTELDVRAKYIQIGEDPRGRQEALKSWRDFKEKNTQVEYCQKVDVFAFGVVLYEILTHCPPWENEDDVFHKTCHGERPPVEPETRASYPRLCTLMERCWHQDPSKRPTFKEAFDELAPMLREEEGKSLASEDDGEAQGALSQASPFPTSTPSSPRQPPKDETGQEKYSLNVIVRDWYSDASSLSRPTSALRRSTWSAGSTLREPLLGSGLEETRL